VSYKNNELQRINNELISLNNKHEQAKKLITEQSKYISILQDESTNNIPKLNEDYIFPEYIKIDKKYNFFVCNICKRSFKKYSLPTVLRHLNSVIHISKSTKKILA